MSSRGRWLPGYQALAAGDPEENSMTNFWRLPGTRLLLVGCLGLSGCAANFPALGPDYVAPPAASLLTTSQWQAALPHQGESAQLAHWWQSFQDPLLDELLARAASHSPGLQLAVARIDEARAGLSTARAAYGPTGELSAYRMRNNGSKDVPAPALTSSGATLDAQWELDLFGRVRRGNEAARAQLSGATQNWHAARVSLAAEVASRYVDYRACQLTQAALQGEAASRAHTAGITQRASAAGILAPADAQLAQAAAAEMQGFLLAQQASCDILRKGLVTLTGMAEVELSRRLNDLPAQLPRPAAFAVPAVPLALLAQRPDLAAAEQALVAANAEVGIATANRYPRLALMGSLMHDKSQLAGNDYHTRPWSFGPTLSLPILNAAPLAAQQRAAEARQQQALAQYRQAVLLAVQEVETNLVQLASSQARSTQAASARAGYQQHATATERQWQAGGLSLLALEEARRLASSATRQQIEVEHSALQAWISLYKALGGGWQAQDGVPDGAPSAGAQATAALSEAPAMTALAEAVPRSVAPHSPPMPRPDPDLSLSGTALPATGDAS